MRHFSPILIYLVPFDVHCCLLIRIIRTILRLMILKITRRPGISPPLPERDFDPSNVVPPSTSSTPTLAPSSQSSSPSMSPEHLKNNHLPLEVNNSLLTSPPPLTSDTPVEDYLLPKALSVNSVKSPTSIMRPLTSPSDWLSEVLYIMRPLVYGMYTANDFQGLLRWLNNNYSVGAITLGTTTMNPLVISISMDILSRYLRRVPGTASALERQEYARRDRDLLWYLLRGSVWQSYTRFVLVLVLLCASYLTHRLDRSWSHS